MKAITNTELNQDKTYLKNKLNYFYKLIGKKRFQRLGYLILNNYEDSPKQIYSKYEKLCNDCWEMTTFYDRITNKGFMRYSRNAIEQCIEQLSEILINAKKQNIIK